jgi:hypothetical protein
MVCFSPTARSLSILIHLTGYTCSANGFCVSAADYNKAVKLTTGVFIGIAVGVVILVLGCCGCGIFLCVRHRKKKKLLYGNPQTQAYAPAPMPMQPQPPQSSHGNQFIAAPSPGYSSQTGIEYPQSPVPQQNQPFSPTPGTAAYEANTPYQSYGTPAPAYTNSPQFSMVSPIASTPGGYGNQGGYANANKLEANSYPTKEGYEMSNVSVNTHTTGVTGTSGVSGISHTPYSQTQHENAFELPATKEDTAYELPAQFEKK